MRFLRTIWYFLAEGIEGLWRHKTLHIFALFIVSISLYVLGFSRYVTRNIGSLLISWQGNLEIRLFLDEGLPEERIAQLQKKFSSHPSVASVRYISPAQALDMLEKISPAFTETARELPQNPLPPSLAITLKTPVDLNLTKRLTAEAKKEAGVQQVLFDWEWVDRLRTYTRFAASLGWVLFAVLGMAALFTVAAITKILALSRREEIAVLHFMGATASTIRGPFVAGGALLGTLAGLLALGLLAATHAAIRHYAGDGALFLHWISSTPLPPDEQLYMTLSGFLLGGIGGAISVSPTEHWS